jgi:Type I restriction enzyme R protein N terminus (HSDR_N)
MVNADSPIIDFITGRSKPNAGAEANRQAVERLLVEVKGYAKEEIEVDAPITLEMGTQRYHTAADLVVRVQGLRFMVIKCAAGALASREKEIIAAARLMENYQIPLAAASDGKSAIVWDSVSGRCLGEGLDAIPSKTQAFEAFDAAALLPLDENRRLRQQLIFKSYDSMNIHRSTPQTVK